jgi:hypothetical protein
VIRQNLKKDAEIIYVSKKVFFKKKIYKKKIYYINKKITELSCPFDIE